jgi:hypothetical protein
VLSWGLHMHVDTEGVLLWASAAHMCRAGQLLSDAIRTWHI